MDEEGIILKAARPDLVGRRVRVTAVGSRGILYIGPVGNWSFPERDQAGKLNDPKGASIPAWALAPA